MENQNENYLQHHGIKGQKWGVRKDPEPGQGRSKTGNSEYDELVKYEKEHAKLERKEEKRQKRERNKKIFLGVALTAAGMAVVATLIKKFRNKSASQAISENKATIAVGKEYVTGYSNVPIKNLASSRRLGIHNYMGKNRTYNVTTNTVSSMRRNVKMFKGMTRWG